MTGDGGRPASDRVPRAEYPWWVALSLWGVPGRAGVWAFFWLSVGLAVGCVVYGLWDARFFYGAAFLFSALMYGLTIRWVDRYGSWGPDPGSGPPADQDW